MKKQIKYISAGMLAGMLLCGGELQASNRMTEMYVCLADAIQKDNRRTEISNRLFRSTAVEGNSPCTETFEECEVGMDVYQLFPRIHWTLPYISVKEAMANRIRSYIRAIFTPCGYATPVRRYGLMCN